MCSLSIQSSIELGGPILQPIEEKIYIPHSLPNLLPLCKTINTFVVTHPPRFVFIVFHYHLFFSMCASHGLLVSDIVDIVTFPSESSLMAT